MSLNTLGYYWREAFLSIFRNGWLSLASVGTVTISLLILGISVLLVMNAQAFTKSLESGVEIRVFLENGATREEIRDMEKELKKTPGVATVEFVSRDEALEEMRENLGDRKDILEGLEEDNPLPDAFKIKAEKANDVPALASQMEKLEKVDQVNYGRGIVEKLLAVIKWVRLAGGGLMVILGVAALLLISTTIRLSLFARRREIGIMKFLGATNWFVRFPFLLEGMILGFVGAAIASSVVYLGYVSLVNRLDEVLPFVTLVTDRQILLTVTGGLMGIGIVVGALGSAFSVRKYIQV
ncbi:cell division protein FtsX [Desulfocucumis palustris]|uniref:Cell division protein FtsX n=1 Tax=Desulfocucumis palustris TaxID=1898651 RepID=A0A2L2XGQ2_9FIRM|nr:permease-like cell division protein FtsX [Desulfocucumis palustris]GBF35549.1 cell division protein FtsX [Desulfocucumis palustris]